ncbi:hypothetical protein [uncultured Stenotrophomonas sp.]|uniref:hypothetical protein n=1 Tax=uncultured Stenotrophomonas sp. TaxID=165438 RepID=UPI0028E7933A|nr:hypothetical protein [uncultured Stenotrophomonas sp.]
MNTPTRSFRIAAVGLDVLHQTRLKLASSMLLAERMEVVLQPWSGDSCDLLVIGLDHADSARALSEAHAANVPVLSIARRFADPAPGRLPHGATVRAINEQLSSLLLAAPSVERPVQGVPLLLQLAASGGAALHLLQRGGITVLVDTATRSIALAPSTTLSDVVTQLDDVAWSASPLDADTFQHQYAYRLPQRHSFEALYFCIARHRPELLPQVAEHTPLKLRQWPDLNPEDVPSTWLLAIACLHARPWQANALAAACQIPRHTVQSLFCAAVASGLALNQEPAVTPPPRRRDAGDSRFFSWVARRFGLNLFQGNSA